MDTLFEGFPGSLNGFKFNHGLVSSCSNQSLVNGFKFNHDFKDPYPSFLQTNLDPPSDSFPSSGTSSDGDSPDSNAVLKYISDILMEEDLEGKTCMLQDCLALQAAEKSFHDVLVHPGFNQSIENPDDSSDNYSISNYLVDSPESTLVEPNMYSEVQSFDQFSRGLGEATISLSNGESVNFASRGRKNFQRDDYEYLEEERSKKLSALSIAEAEESEMFDEVLLCKDDGTGSCLNRKMQQNGRVKGSNGGTTRTKKRGNKREVVDLWTLLTQCAQTVASYDQRTANQLLKQIRQHSNAFGDGTQRLAHYFADGLEARLGGSQTPIHTHMCMRASAADVLKAYQMFVQSCPFKRVSFLLANKTIAKVAEKATRLHIIDFGICYGFQWPCLIQFLSKRTTGPPMLRITGIDLPQPGFRPAERIEETGRRLKDYCKRFNVPFEYTAIAQKWETIKLEDLKINRDEVTVVNCMERMRNLPDETVVDSSPRDTVLNLIKRIQPDIFIHGVVNGNHNAPFFLTRFREALYHFSSWFDMFEATIPREDEARMLFEKEIFGKDAMNAIACEGTERVERPETYKQWQVRNVRAGFRQVPLDQEILKEARTLKKSNYHQDFVIDEDGHWMLQGWKGRIIQALSFWKPVQD